MTDSESSSSNRVEPLLVLEDLRVDVAGVPTCDGLTAQSKGDRILVLGAPQALFQATCGLSPVVRGVLRVRGTDASNAVRLGFVAGVPLDVPLPPRWTVREYVVWSSRLVGHSRRKAQELADMALEYAQLASMAATPLEQVLGYTRRSVSLAAALATDASVIVLEDPLASLPEEDAFAWAKLMVDALRSVSWMAFAGHVPLTSPLSTSADEALLVSSSRLYAQGPPTELAAESRRFLLRIHGPLAVFEELLAQRGARLDIHGAQVTVDLGASMTTSELLQLANEAEATVVEMFPRSRSLS